MIIKGKKLNYQSIDSDIKIYEKSRKLTTGQGEDYTTEYLLDYEYVKNHYRLVAADLCRKKELDVNPKATPNFGVSAAIRLFSRNFP